MYRQLFLLLVLAGAAIALSDVNQQCISDNSDTWSNDNLIGTWYKIWRFELFGGLVPSSICTEMVFTRPTSDIVQAYKAKYNDPTLPYNLDDNPVLVNNGLVDGLVTGHNVAKFYVLTPNTTMILNWDGYAVNAYKQLSPKYILYTECALRGNSRWLLSNDRYAPVAEMEELIKNTPELSRLDQQRYCATY